MILNSNPIRNKTMHTKTKIYDDFGLMNDNDIDDKKNNDIG